MFAPSLLVPIGLNVQTNLSVPRFLRLYRARAAITKQLTEEHGFSIVAIEGDWPDCHVIDSYVRQHPSATQQPKFQYLNTSRSGCGETRRFRALSTGFERTTFSFLGRKELASLDWISMAWAHPSEP